MFWTTLGNALFIFALRLAAAAMSTVRMVMVVRGMRKWAAVTGFVEMTIWVVAVSKVLTSLDSIWNVVGFSSGFAAGVLVGMWIEDRLALGYADMDIVSMTKGEEIAARLRKAGYGATRLQAEGQSGPVCLIHAVTSRKHVAEVIRLVNEVDATAFVTVEDARWVLRGHHRLGK